MTRINDKLYIVEDFSDFGLIYEIEKCNKDVKGQLVFVENGIDTGDFSNTPVTGSEKIDWFVKKFMDTDCELFLFTNKEISWTGFDTPHKQYVQTTNIDEIRD